MRGVRLARRFLLLNVSSAGPLGRREAGPLFSMWVRGHFTLNRKTSVARNKGANLKPSQAANSAAALGQAAAFCSVLPLLEWRACTCF